MDWSPINYREELNDEQYLAVTAEDGPALVLAGAGSGKTRTLTYRVAYLLLEKGIDPDRLLLLTFTNKAAKEMLERVKSLAALTRIPRWSGTFHSIGGRILRQHGHHLGLNPNYTIMDQSDTEAFLTKLIKEEDKNFLKNKDNPKPKVIHSHISFSRNTMRPLEDILLDRYYHSKHLVGDILKFAEIFHAQKLEQQVVDYDDLLVYWLKLLTDFPEVQHLLTNRFTHILVDEYQDTNSLQSEIIDRIGTHHNIMAVGDDAQCIYTWRGANFENIHRFDQRHPGAKIYPILTNYRSSPEILEFANGVLSAQPSGSGYEKELIPFKKSRTRPYVVPVIDTKRQAQFLVSRIEGLYDEGYALSDIAILYRAHYQALDTQLEFTRRGIPFVITSGIRFFEQAHIKDFVAQLRVLTNPTDSSAWDRLLGLLPRVGPATIQKILTAARKLLLEAQKKLASTKDLFHDNTQNPAPSIFDYLTHEKVIAKVPLDAREEFKQLSHSLQEVFPLLKKAETDESIKPADIVDQLLKGWYSDYIKTAYPDGDDRHEDLIGLVDFADRFSTLPELLAQLVLLNSETGEKTIEPDDSAVRMTTIHQAKGLEFPIVFVISCAEDLLPLKRSVESGNIEEERRLFYVAVTRSMEELYLITPLLNNGRGGSIRLQPSRFLVEIPPNRYEKLHFNSGW